MIWMDRLLVGLDAWIIQDGNYPDLRQGQQAEFALELPLEHLEVASVPGQTLKRV
jgi:hypothetical protein